MVTHFTRMKEWQFPQYINQKDILEVRREINQVQEKLESAIQAKEERLEQLKASIAHVNILIEKAKYIPAIKHLTPKLLRLFIQRIKIWRRLDPMHDKINHRKQKKEKSIGM